MIMNNTIWKNPVTRMCIFTLISRFKVQEVNPKLQQQ